MSKEGDIMNKPSWKDAPPEAVIQKLIREEEK
jgi:hypothetical protein